MKKFGLIVVLAAGAVFLIIGAAKVIQTPSKTEMVVESLPRKFPEQITDYQMSLIGGVRWWFNYLDRSEQKLVLDGERILAREVRKWRNGNKVYDYLDYVEPDYRKDFRGYKYTSWKENGYRVAFEQSWDPRFPPSKSWQETVIVFPNGLLEPVKKYTTIGDHSYCTDENRKKILFFSCARWAEETGITFDRIATEGQKKLRALNL